MKDDDFAEYRDASVLGRLNHDHLRAGLAEFWRARGPQWDALALTDRGQLVEAKAHIPEMLSPGSQASAGSRERIDAALLGTAAAMGATPKAPWPVAFYQLANRFAALHFLVRNGVDAYLVFANFVGDADMSGPNNEAEWRGAYLAAHYTLGLPSRHVYSKRIIHIHPAVTDLKD